MTKTALALLSWCSESTEGRKTGMTRGELGGGGEQRSTWSSLKGRGELLGEGEIGEDDSGRMSRIHGKSRARAQ